ncbi:MAG: hypothetical protein COB36_14960 [Alphaproteobacteria bacterium]|nr:MAG: hypothetical protein COB36_14960 [Alphaproteobacteria bacterium]
MILYKGDDKRLRTYSIFMIILAIFFLMPLVAEHTWEAGMVWQDGRTNESIPMMLKAMYLSLSICLVMGAKDPVRNAIIIDYSIISSLIHGLVMLYYSIILEWERAHLYGDVLLLLVTAAFLFFYHPRKISKQ